MKESNAPAMRRLTLSPALTWLAALAAILNGIWLEMRLEDEAHARKTGAGVG